ncbi:MAG: carboxyl transferase domain-containing protein [Rhodospirillales bacterium]
MDKSLLEELEARRKKGREPGLVNKKNSQSQRVEKLSARERVNILLDPGSFEEIGVLARSQHPDLYDRSPADGVIAGSGKINGRTVYVSSDDPTVLAGTRGRVGELKTARVRELADKHRKPYIALMEAGAGRFQEINGATAAGVGNRFREHFRLSGRVPTVACFMGACFGGPSFTGQQSDFITIVDGTGFMGMSGPPVVKVGIGIDVTREEIGSGQMSAAVTGQADHLGADEKASLLAIRDYLSFMPSSCYEMPPIAEPKPAMVDTPEGKEKINALVSENHRRGYNMLTLVQMLVDGGELFVYRPLYGRNVLTSFARVKGRPVGIVANNPMHLAGALNHEGGTKARKFIDLCDAFHIPLIFLCDCPGFLVGPDMEKNRMVALAGRMLNSVIGASVPKVTIVVRKAIGLAYIAMGGKTMNPDAIVGWPTSFFDAMGPAAGVELVHGRKIKEAANPEELRAQLMQKVLDEGNGYFAAERALIDDIIAPAETRDLIISVLERHPGDSPPEFKHRVDP